MMVLLQLWVTVCCFVGCWHILGWCGGFVTRVLDRRYEMDRLAIDLEVQRLEREALDQTIRWAYNQGWHQMFDEDHNMAVTEFRHRWGDDRREVR
jgi:hypothetical protein